MSIDSYHHQESMPSSTEKFIWYYSTYFIFRFTLDVLYLYAYDGLVNVVLNKGKFLARSIKDQSKEDSVLYARDDEFFLALAPPTYLHKIMPCHCTHQRRHRDRLYSIDFHSSTHLVRQWVADTHGTVGFASADETFLPWGKWCCYHNEMNRMRGHVLQKHGKQTFVVAMLHLIGSSVDQSSCVSVALFKWKDRKQEQDDAEKRHLDALLFDPIPSLI